MTVSLWTYTYQATSHPTPLHCLFYYLLVCQTTVVQMDMQLRDEGRRLVSWYRFISNAQEISKLEKVKQSAMCVGYHCDFLLLGACIHKDTMGGGGDKIVVWAVIHKSTDHQLNFSSSQKQQTNHKGY